ncbi:methionine--tRNA ligase [Desulfohalovibrio reitneri]|uniref:methionine--tRNA ligase n=1 Tax=Desulfohalovibrio reitneri TaxID=1307759 RepID=UPI0004A6C781|nr:methionine--tRNA ligase [Desulfohalovibrio reitneri]
MSGAFYITTPIYYVNANPHLGHAYTTIVADCLARFHRALGEETFFLTGTDEHGDKIAEAAAKNGREPQQYADEVSATFRDLWPGLGITNDDFIRTTEDRHVRVVREILQKVYDSGDIYYGEYGGHYCTGCECFLTEKDLEDGLCPDHKTKPQYISEKNYFFRMSKYREWLIEHIEANPEFIRPERYRGEVLSLLRSSHLDDLCISRPKSRLSWGIELPFDSDYVCYVWFDALINYLSALDWPDGERFKNFWPAAQHLVAKDILKPHAVFWPTMLRAAGLPVYKHLNVHGYWLVKETKMSKSLGNVVRPLDMADRYGLDTFRFFLLREMRFGNDASFSEEALVSRRNADLANDLGNLFSRVLSMTKKYRGSVVPGAAVDEALRERAMEAVRNYVELFSRCRFAEALEALWELVRSLNKHIDETAPWVLHKEGRDKELDAVLYGVLECLRKVACCLHPVMPEAGAAMLTQLGQTVEGPRIDREMETFGRMEPGTEVAAKSNLFPRVELEAAEPGDSAKPAKPKDKKKGKGKAKEDAAAAESETAMVEFDDFAALDLRVGVVRAAEVHPKADRLLLLQVDLGEEDGPRQVVAGLAEHFAPDVLVGRAVTVVANLKPRKLRGQLSQGMVLTVGADGGLDLLGPSGEVPPGSKVS